MILLVKSPTLTVDQPEFRSDFLSLIDKLQKDPTKPNITTFYDTGSPAFVSRDRKATYALIGVSGDADAAYVRYNTLLTSTPGLAVSLGGPAVPKTSAGEGSSNAWRALGSFVVRWPGPVLVVSLGILIAAGEPFLHVRFANPGLSSLPSGFSARSVSEEITRDFPTSENPPIELLVTLPQCGSSIA